MFGSLGSAKLELKSQTKGVRSSAFTSIQGAQTRDIKEWKESTVTVRLSSNSQLVFEATSGQRHLSDIAVDEVSVSRFIQILYCHNSISYK